MAMSGGTNDSVTTDLDQLSFTYRAQQTGFDTSEDAVLYQSISKRLPLIFGKLTPSTSERVLPACPTFRSWDNLDGETSFVENKRRDLEQCVNHLMHKIESQLADDAQEVASTLIRDSQKFCIALFKFMTDTVSVSNHARDGAGKKSEHETWLYVSHAVRAIFDYLYEFRIKAKLHRKDPAAMVWHFMKVREEQNKILKVGIQDFHIVTNVLHVHMRRNAVMRTEFNERLLAMGNTVKVAKDVAEKASKRADLAKTTADAAMKKK